MQLGLKEETRFAARDYSKPRALAISLGLHVLTFALLMEAPPLSLPTMPPPSPTEYQQAFAGKEDKIVWYKFRDLPNVTPQNSPKANRPLRAAVKAKQSIISSPKNAPKRSQVVLTAAPAAELPPLDLPNMIAVKLPPKQFTTPPDLVRPEPAKIELPVAPEATLQPLEVAKLQADRLPPKPFTASTVRAPTPAVKVEAPSAAPETALQSIELAKLRADRLPPKPFTSSTRSAPAPAVKLEAPSTAPETTLQAVETAKLRADRLPPRPFTASTVRTPTPTVKLEAPSDAPEYKAQSTVTTKLPATRLPARAFMPPPAATAREMSRIASAAEAPTLAPNAPSAVNVAGVRLPARAFAPPAPAAAPQKRNVAAPTIEANPGDVTIAIAGLNPATTAVALPAASSPAQFSAGEKVRPEGATADGSGKGITLPDLFAHSATDQKPELMAMLRTAPVSREALNDALGNRRQTIPGEARAVATKVTQAPDPRFNGRDVYMMAIQMPNLTSYSGSWLMWYAARTARQAELQPIAAPEPHRKVDPKYIATAVEERVEGRVQLYCVIGRDGTVGSIELLHGIDARLDRSAEEALSKWEFYPATRNGQPVDVDVVVEIPFVLAPHSAAKR